MIFLKKRIGEVNYINRQWQTPHMFFSSGRDCLVILFRGADKNLATFYLKVVPLSQRSGIVEWCENTVPLGEYLVGIRGIGGAHSKYHPTDWAAAECRKKFSVRKNKRLHSGKLKPDLS